MKRIEGMVATMVGHLLQDRQSTYIQPDTVLENQSNGSYGPVTTSAPSTAANQAGLVTSATGAAGALAGWAIASLGAQLSSKEQHSSLSASAANSLAVPTSAAANGLSVSSPTSSPRPSTDSTGIFERTPPTASSSKLPGIRHAAPRPTPPKASTSRAGMKLGGSKKPTSGLAEELAAEWDDDDVGNAWGNDDLIDVNADADDWGDCIPLPKCNQLTDSRFRKCAGTSGRAASGTIVLCSLCSRSRGRAQAHCTGQSTEAKTQTSRGCAKTDDADHCFD